MGTGQFDADDCDQSFANVVTGKSLFDLFEQVIRDSVVVECSRQRGLETDHVRTAFMGIDVVGERKDLLLISIVVLHRNLEIDAFANTLEIDDFVVQWFLVLVQVLNKRNDSAGIVKFVLLFVSLVFDGDEQSPIEKGHLPQPLGKNVKTELSGFENFVIRLETHFGSPPVRVARHFQGSCRNPAVIALHVDFSAPPDLKIQPLGKRVDNRDPHAMQSA